MITTFNEYQTNAMRTAKMFDSAPMNLVHAALGICTEGGEFTSEVKRIAIYGKASNVEMIEHMIEELGDLMWYIALAADSIGVSMEEMARLNIEKLQLRYPEKYSDIAAEARADKGGLSARES